MKFDALWDTGATNSVITQNVVDACSLAATGMAFVEGVHGKKEVETYLVNIALPGKVVFAGLRVSKGELKDADILIGMDVISAGDFAVTNLGGKTKFSFRIPSQIHIDFVDESKKAAAAKAPPMNRAARRRAKKKPRR